MTLAFSGWAGWIILQTPFGLFGFEPGILRTLPFGPMAIQLEVPTYGENCALYPHSCSLVVFGRWAMGPPMA